MEYDSLQTRCRAAATSRVGFPYVPGYFAFREIPALLEALRLLSPLPDLILVHGHGYAHPRRAGIATHLGVLLQVPTIGIAESLLGGMDAKIPENRRGAISPVVMDGEIVGSLLRPGVGRAPICISPGFRTTLPRATEIVLRCMREHRLPEPLYLADSCAGRFRSETYEGG
jgi:deoxyribonuclease V